MRDDEILSSCSEMLRWYMWKCSGILKEIKFNSVLRAEAFF